MNSKDQKKEEEEEEEEMEFHKEDLDVVLVPAGLLVMFLYHLNLLYRYLHRPHTTQMGFENHDKLAWVKSIMQSDKKDIGTCLGVLSSSISAATFLCSVSLTLSSLIGAWISNSSSNFFQSNLIYGDTRTTTISIKYISLLACFLLAFACFVQSARHFIHANYLISTPTGDESLQRSIEIAIIRGSNFWSVGLRALYFAINLLLWFFGPIPMFVGSISMSLMLHYLDSNSEPLNQHQYLKRAEKMVEERITEVSLAIHGHRKVEVIK